MTLDIVALIRGASKPIHAPSPNTLTGTGVLLVLDPRYGRPIAALRYVKQPVRSCPESGLTRTLDEQYARSIISNKSTSSNHDRPSRSSLVNRPLHCERSCAIFSPVSPCLPSTSFRTKISRCDRMSTRGHEQLARPSSFRLTIVSIPSAARFTCLVSMHRLIYLPC